MPCAIRTDDPSGATSFNRATKKPNGLSLDTRKVSRAGQELHLSPICWTLLECLMRASPEPVTRERLETTIWGDEPPDSGALRTHIHELRLQVDRSFDAALITTVHSVGWRMQA